MTIGLLTVELFLPSSGSLKDKRMVLRRLKDRLKAANVSVAEVAHQELWQRAGLAVVAVSSDHSVVEGMLASALEAIERLEPDSVTTSQVEYLN